MSKFKSFSNRYEDLASSYDDEIAEITCSDMTSQQKGVHLVLASIEHRRALLREIRVLCVDLSGPSVWTVVLFFLGLACGILIASPS